MSDTPQEPEVSELLRAIGKARMPEQRVLEDAREVLWAAIAGEMLGTGPAGERAAATAGPAAREAGREEEPRKRARRGQRPQPHGQRRMSTGGGGPDTPGS